LYIFTIREEIVSTKKKYYSTDDDDTYYNFVWATTKISNISRDFRSKWKWNNENNNDYYKEWIVYVARENGNEYIYTHT